MRSSLAPFPRNWQNQHMRSKHAFAPLAACLLASAILTTTTQAWGPQGHRLVARIAADNLTDTARRNAAWLLDGRSLADVAVWADEVRDGVYQTYLWHFVNIDTTAAAYDRDRDCPTQSGVERGTSADRWRDCIVDRILYNRERLGNLTLDRADRAVALKFLVHLVGDVHQPMHALGVARGGNDIPVQAFGSPTCQSGSGRSFPCNLHVIWDATLIEHRQLDDAGYHAALTQAIAKHGWDRQPVGAPADWATQSHIAGNAALLPPNGDANETYYAQQIPVVDQRLALAGLRLARLLNEVLVAPPPMAGHHPGDPETR